MTAPPAPSPVDADLEDWLRFSLVPGLGPIAARRLLGAFGGPSAALGAGRARIAGIVGDRLADAFRQGADTKALARALDWSALPGNRLLTLADADYPRTFLQIPDPPIALYVRGRLDLLARPAIAIVGSRNATPQGLANATAFARTLSAAGLTVVSGLALGIDAAAHRGALEHSSSTIAVLGTGIDIVYPRRNAELTEAIAARGTLVSEVPLGTPALAQNFPRRNRLISGLSRGCLVVEAALQSGSLITARVAADQGRDVFALPGSIHSPLAKGCHALIKQGAKLVESAADVLEELQLVAPSPRMREQRETAEDAPTEQLLVTMGHDPVHPDKLCTLLNLTPDVVSAMLLTLEMSGRIASLPGGRFQRLA